MQLVCEAEVTSEYDIRVEENIKKRLHPGEIIRIKEYVENLYKENITEKLDSIYADNDSKIEKEIHHAQLSILGKEE